VSDLSKRRGSMACPRCKATMDEVVWIAPLQDEPGLIGYECPSCRYVTSVFWHGPTEPKAP
jgi:transposase-like protein